jgi:hypothetical protein
MALTAASPVFRGRLVDTDTRWDVIAGSVDCRTPAERGMIEPVRDVASLPFRATSCLSLNRDAPGTGMAKATAR